MKTNLLACPRLTKNEKNVNDHDEYDCEVKPFWVAHYNDGSADGLVYVGIDYKHPN